jgi:dTDP-4-dehydrorhamnose reductase
MTDLVIGANGMVGRSLMSYLSDSVGTFHISTSNSLENRKYEYLDITEKDKVNALFEKHKPKRVFIAAANPHVDGCENPETDKVNIAGVSSILENCYVHNSQVVFFSSSYVFDGKSQTPYKPKDSTEPINRYGRQKEQIEKVMTRNWDGELQYLIIRTVGVFGQEGKSKNFVSQVVKAVAENKKIHVPLDQTMNPIWSMDLAKIAIHLSDRYSGDIFHVAGNQCLSKYEWAIKIAYRVGCKKPHDLVIGMKSEDMKQMAIRPSNGCLDCGSLTARAITIPNLERSLGKFLDA